VRLRAAGTGTSTTHLLKPVQS